MNTSLTVIFLGIALPMLADQVSKTERVHLDPGGTLRLDDSSGYVHVEAWDQPDVEVTVVKSTKREHATQLLDRVRVTTERRSGSQVVISTLPRRGDAGVTLELQIRAPRAARLEIHHSGGYVLVSGMAGDIEATNRFGDIMLMLPENGAYSIDARNRVGGVYSDFAGAGHNLHMMGKRFTRDAPAPSHRIYLRMGMGGITILSVPAKPEAPLVTSWVLPRRSSPGEV